MIQSNQVKLRYGKKLDGTPVYGSLTDMTGGKLPVLDASAKSFTVTADADVHVLASGEFPVGNLYVDGTSYEAINGGVPVASVPAIGTAGLDKVIVGDRTVNIVRILDVNNDEVVVNTSAVAGVKDAKLVYGLVQSSSTDGAPIDDTNMQLSFVVLDDATSAFVAYTLPAGDYKFQATRMYTVGTASKADKLSTYISGGMIGGLALDEVLTLVEAEHGVASFEFTAEVTVVDPTTLSIVFVDATTAKLMVDGAEVTTVTKAQDARKTFKTVNAGKYASFEGVSLEINGTRVSPVNTAIVDNDSFSFVVPADFMFYIGSDIVASW